MDLMLQPLRKYAQFTGRARRSEYWLFFLFYVVIAVVAVLLDELALHGLPALQVLVSLALLVPGLAVGFRRLHDIDRSAWWMLIGFIPLIGAIVLLVFAVLPGTIGPNRFGPDPKAGEPTPDPIAA
jgi:uncharacterized membrane protein YhaH (DUF805 family)